MLVQSRTLRSAIKQTDRMRVSVVDNQRKPRENRGEDTLTSFGYG